VTSPAGRRDSEAVKASKAAAEEARAKLTRLHENVVEAEDHLVSTNATQLCQANEQLLVATLSAQTDADTCEKKLTAVARAAELDPLTKLPNRALLQDRFAQAILRAKRDNTLVALLFLDLDDFKQINDTIGHAAGDQALQRAARCLVSAVREVDTVSRHGGDEFLILLAGVSQASDAGVVAEKVLAAPRTPGAPGDPVLRLTASIGISVYPQDGDNADTLIELADAAMYVAKRHGHGRVAYHGQEPKGDPSSKPPGLPRSPR
jgi:diguanylate cyclase (GGDEF)-like protein